MPDKINGGRELAYRQLHDSEELHRATLSNISDAVFLTDDDDRFTFVCPNVDVIFGYSPDEVKALERISKLLGDALFDRADLAARGEIRNIERQVTVKSGEARTILVHVKAVSIQGGTVLYCCRDVTELKHAEEELRAVRAELTHVSRLALVGQLVASITHEVKQPLTAILANAGAGHRILAQTSEHRTSQELREIFDDIDNRRRSCRRSDRTSSHARPQEAFDAPAPRRELARPRDVTPRRGRTRADARSRCARSSSRACRKSERIASASNRCCSVSC